MKKHYLISACIIFSLGVSTSGFAQRELSIENLGNRTDGGPLSTIKYENVSGSPYFIEEWNTATVKFTNGKTLKEVKVKYDLVADVLLFESKGQELLFIDPIEAFKINLSETGDYAYFKRIKSAGEGFYQLLFDGTTSLCKKNKKIIVDKTPFNSATTVKILEPKISYYIYQKGKMVEVKNTEKSVLGALTNKRAELANLIKKENLNLNDDNDLIKLLAYYNTL